MANRESSKNKVMYNNYQFYENSAFVEFLEKQLATGYCLKGAIGQFCNILKFRFSKTEVAKSYAFYCKHLDEEIDAVIEKIKKDKCEIVCENYLFVLFRFSSNEISELRPEMVEKKQNRLLGISIKKAVTYISILLLIVLIGLGLKIVLLKNGNSQFNLMSLGLYIALMATFLFYLTGDIHDIFAGKGTCTEGKLYFTGRTKFKDMLFRIGDILKYGTLLASICTTILILLNSNDVVVSVNLFRMWLVYVVVGFGYRLRFRRSYITLLLVEVFLLANSFY